MSSQHRLYAEHCIRHLCAHPTFFSVLLLSTCIHVGEHSKHLILVALLLSFVMLVQPCNDVKEPAALRKPCNTYSNINAPLGRKMMVAKIPFQQYRIR